MNETAAETLRVPGASLYYKVRGSGPILLIIAGGGGDADSSDRFADLLRDRFTVVTYDRRGYWRSPLDDPDQAIQIQIHSEDVHHLLAAVTGEPAYVLGSSIGALIGLDLVIHHPEQVRVLVAHEPPLAQLMSADAPRGANPGDLPRLYREEGGAAAIQKFAASLGIDRGGQNTNLGLPQQNAQAAEHNREAFFKYDTGAAAHYVLDIPALRAAPTRIILAGGSAGRAYFPYLCAARLAERMGTTLVEFPGNHAAFAGQAQEFAERLVAVLG